MNPGPDTGALLPLSPVGETRYERVMGHAPHVLEPWSALEQVFFRQSILPAGLLEQVRRTLALGHGCAYCQTKGGPPDACQLEPRTVLAVALAVDYAADHRSIDPDRVSMLRTHFSDAELVELVAFIGFMWAGGTFGRILGIQPPAEADPVPGS